MYVIIFYITWCKPKSSKWRWIYIYPNLVIVTPNFFFVELSSLVFNLIIVWHFTVDPRQTQIVDSDTCVYECILPLEISYFL